MTKEKRIASKALPSDERAGKLYTEVHRLVPQNVMSNKNRAKSWQYGYNKKYDLVVISRTGDVGQIVCISGINIGLPPAPKHIEAEEKKEEQYWRRKNLPSALSRIVSIFQWNLLPLAFKNKWVDYIEAEFDTREEGHWFMNNGIATYMTGAHYMYVQWASIDVGYPDFREANRVFFLFWEACKADPRCYGMSYLKIRRSGFSFMGSSECANIATLAKKGRVGILSKTGPDAKKMFTDKVVPIATKLPWFFRPIQDGMDKPKSEMAYRIPASKITKKNMHLFDADAEEVKGLDTTIDWRNTDDNSYDGEKLILLVHDESGKWLNPNSVVNNWRVTKTCLRLGKRIIGKCLMGSTSNALSKGGANFKKLYEDSKTDKRSRNGQTKSGLYSLFIPMEYNMEGFIDRFGEPVMRTPDKPVLGVDDEMIDMGAIDYWEGEEESYKDDPDALNEFYRQFSRTESHAFRDESKSSLFNLTKIYQQLDYSDTLIEGQHVTRGSFGWKDGILDTRVIFYPDKQGRFLVSWTPKPGLQNRLEEKGRIKLPGNAHMGAFGCDSYDISGVVGGGGSKGSLHGLTRFHMEEAPTNEFFLEYIARPQTAEIFFEEMLMACIFYGMPILIENNKPRLLYHFKNRGYRGFSLNRPDKHYSKLSKTEKELGGMPNSSEDVKQAHAAAIESHIEKYVGIDMEGTFRDPDEMGTMPFVRTLEDWAAFDINNRTKHDASISSGLAIMANQRHLYTPEQKQKKISLTFAKYSNSGTTSEIIR